VISRHLKQHKQSIQARECIGGQYKNHLETKYIQVAMRITHCNIPFHFLNKSKHNNTTTRFRTTVAREEMLDDEYIINTS